MPLIDQLKILILFCEAPCRGNYTASVFCMTSPSVGSMNCCNSYTPLTTGIFTFIKYNVCLYVTVDTKLEQWSILITCQNEICGYGACNVKIKITGSLLLTWSTVYPKKYAHGFCFAVLCCGYTLTDFPISTRLTSLTLWQSNDCPSASKATLMNMDKYFMWIHYERLHNHNKAKHTKPCAYFLGYTIHEIRA